MLLSLFPIVGLVAAAPLANLTLTKRASVCNGHAELCSRKYSQVSYVGAHDSFTDSSISPAADQELSISDLLNRGVRMLQAQGHKGGSGPSGVEFCHTSCALYDGGTLENYLSQVASWMSSNPTEVLTLLVTNGDNIPPANWAKAFVQTGLDKLSYAPPSPSLGYDAWPTLGSLIDSGKRLVTFMDAHADFNSVPWIIDEFSNMYETPFDTTDSSFPCTVDRVTGSASGKMGLINHYLDKSILGILVPNKDAIETTNSVNSIVAQANDCKARQGQLPTFLLMDFVDHGNPYAAARQLNGLSTGTIRIDSVACGTTSDATLSACNQMINDLAWTSSSLNFGRTCSYGINGKAYNPICSSVGACCLYTTDSSVPPAELRTAAQMMLGCGSQSANKINGRGHFTDEGVVAQGYSICLSDGNGCGDCFDD